MENIVERLTLIGRRNSLAKQIKVANEEDKVKLQKSLDHIEKEILKHPLPEGMDKSLQAKETKEVEPELEEEPISDLEVEAPKEEAVLEEPKPVEVVKPQTNKNKGNNK